MRLVSCVGNCRVGCLQRSGPNIQPGKVVLKHGGTETIEGYPARPKAEGVYPAVIVIAGNVITEEYIPNTCAALAVAGYV